MHAYGFDLNSLIFFYSYLENRKQNVKINNTYSVFQVLYLVSLKNQYWGPFYSTFFVNACLLMSTKNSELHNFADDNTIISSSDTLSQLIQDLQSEANKATDWFDLNNMIIKPEKFQAIIRDKKGQNNNPTEINIDREKNHFWK